MKHCVILDRAEWDRLPVLVAQAIARQAERGPGRFRIVAIDSEAGESPIDDRLDVWLIGTLYLAFTEAQKALAEVQFPPGPGG